MNKFYFKHMPPEGLLCDVVRLMRENGGDPERVPQVLAQDIEAEGPGPVFDDVAAFCDAHVGGSKYRIEITTERTRGVWLRGWDKFYRVAVDVPDPHDTASVFTMFDNWARREFFDEEGQPRSGRLFVCCASLESWDCFRQACEEPIQGLPAEELYWVRGVEGAMMLTAQVAIEHGVHSRTAALIRVTDDDCENPARLAYLTASYVRFEQALGADRVLPLVGAGAYRYIRNRYGLPANTVAHVGGGGAVVLLAPAEPALRYFAHHYTTIGAPSTHMPPDAAAGQAGEGKE